MQEFADRADAGRRLAERLRSLGVAEGVVLGLPRGGVPVAAQVADALDLPLDVVLVRKVGLPAQPELAMGAVGESGVIVRNDDVLRRGAVPDADFAAAVESERRELDRRVRLWRTSERVDVTDRVVVLVDDGIATGATVRAACQVVRRLGARRIIVATPVAPRELTAAALDADDLVIAHAPRAFRAVGMHYRDFTQTTDAEVASCLDRSA